MFQKKKFSSLFLDERINALSANTFKSKKKTAKRKGYNNEKKLWHLCQCDGKPKIISNVVWAV